MSSNAMAQRINFKKDSVNIIKIVDSNSYYIVGQQANSIKDGTWIYYKACRIEKIYTYQANELNGICTFFYYNGAIRMQLTFKNGILNGDANFYSHDGRLLATYEYVHDILGTVKLLLIDKESPPRNPDFRPDY
jgi:antitoxin component YwqK of YwqJK toxin-antitoxin module